MHIEKKPHAFMVVQFFLPHHFQNTFRTKTELTVCLKLTHTHTRAQHIHT